MLKLGHKGLDVWKRSIEFVTLIYKITEKFPQTEIYGITNQLRRASVSVPSNIAEGASRSGIKERRRFFIIARSSIAEIDTQLEISINLGYLDESDQTILSREINEIFAMVSGLVESTK
jgi:four helix bundle protein